MAREKKEVKEEMIVEGIVKDNTNVISNEGNPVNA